MNKNLPIIIIGLVAVLAGIAGIILFSQQNAKQNTNPAGVASNSPAANGKSNSAAPTQQAAPNASAGASPAWDKGDKAAVVTLEEFADFECPSCATFSPVLREIRSIYGNKVRVIFRQYPLKMHPRAEDAARAAEAAGMQGKFFEMHDLLYDKQKSWSKDTPDHRKEFENYAASLGLDVNKFKTDAVGQVAASRVALDKKRGDEMQIKATPSLFFNNRLLVPNDMTTTNLRALIDAELQKAAPQTAAPTASSSVNAGNTNSAKTDRTESPVNKK